MANILSGTCAIYSDTTITHTDEIVITARRTDDNYLQLPMNITVLSARELANLPAHNLAEALNFTSGVDIQFRGPVGQPSSIAIQGSQSSHVRVMVDGILMNSQGMAFADPSQFPIENVERIEIIKGSSSAVWGSSLGGVVNIITKPPQGNKPFQATFSLAAAGGDYQFQRENLEISGRSDKLSYLFWMSGLDSNSEFRPNSDLVSTKFSAKANYALSDDAYLETALHYTGSDIGGYEFPTMGYSEDLRYYARYGSIKFFIAPDDRWEFSAIAKASNQDSKVENFAIPGYAPLAEVASKNIFTGLDLQSTYRIAPASPSESEAGDNQSVSSGVDLGSDSLDSDLMNGKERFSRQGYYVNYLLNSGKVGVNLGARYDDNQAYGSQFSPSAGLVYQLPLDSHFRISYSKAFNAPPLIYKYINTISPNPDLKAERALAVYETSLDTRPVKDLSLKLAYYRSEVKDLVTYDFVNNMMDNIDKVRRQGVEAEAKYNLTEDIQAQAGSALNRVQNRDTGAIVQGGGVAKLTYNLGLNYQYSKDLNLALKGNYRFWNEPVSSNANDRKFIWDMMVNYSLPNDDNKSTAMPSSVFLGVYNIFDRGYWYHELLPMPGRTLEFGVKYTF
ncbi:MAG: TonB-dependent receptor [Planctomycetota bacterium]